MKQYKKDLLILAEGPDGSGKDTLINTLKLISTVETKNRSTISERVYAIKFDRQYTDGIPVQISASYWEYYFKSHYDTRIILCNPDVDTLVRRCLEKNDPIIENKTFEELVKVLKEDKKSFEDISRAVAKKYDFKLLELDTTKTIDECIDKIEEFIEDARI